MNIRRTIVLSLFWLIPGAFAQDNTLTPEETQAGWHLLFDGTDASIRDQWVNYEAGNENTTQLNDSWEAKDGAMHLIDKRSNDIRTKKKYGNFVLLMDFRNDANQGFFYRSTVCGGPIYNNSVEYAIDANTTNMKVYTAAPYDLYPAPVRNAVSHNSPEWDKMIITAIDDTVEQWLNGIKMTAFRYWTPSWNVARAGSKWRNQAAFCRPCTPPNTPATSGYVEAGYLGFQATHGGEWFVKNFKILEDPKFGCMDPTREGYDPDATFDLSAKEVGDSAATMCGPVKVGVRYITEELHGINVSSGNNLEVSLPEGPYSVRVFDLKGNQINYVSGQGPKARISISTTGVYFVNVLSGEFNITKRIAAH